MVDYYQSGGIDVDDDDHENFAKVNNGTKGLEYNYDDDGIII